MVITDPGIERRPSWLDPIASRVITDVRDVPFLTLSFKLTLCIMPLAAMFFLVEPTQFPWWAAGAYWGVLAYYAGPYNLMLHNTSHRQFFKKPYDWANRYIPWALGAFFGHAPDSYFIHHVGMHHPENNLQTDLSSTMPFQRDSLLSFLKYYGLHISSIYIRVPIYLHKKKRFGMRNAFLLSTACYYSAQCVLLYLNWRAALVVFTLPYFTMHLLMMCGNWGQHAFVDERTPENCYRNSITCINAVYNQRCFNDGYHIGHHVKATRHWTEMPADFLANRDTYAREGAIVFRSVDFFMVWGCLMLKRYDWLAKFYVELDGKNRSKEDVMALLKRRTQAIRQSVTDSGQQVAAA